jgi:hypothetical protein
MIVDGRLIFYAYFAHGAGNMGLELKSMYVSLRHRVAQKVHGYVLSDM